MPRSTPRRAGRRTRSRSPQAQHLNTAPQIIQDPQAYRQRTLSPDEERWARELWEHREPVPEIAEQLDVEAERIESLLAGWSRSADDASSTSH